MDLRRFFVAAAIVVAVVGSGGGGGEIFTAHFVYFIRIRSSEM